jgi:hypothetical protein
VARWTTAGAREALAQVPRQEPTHRGLDLGLDGDTALGERGHDTFEGAAQAFGLGLAVEEPSAGERFP